MWKIIFRNEKLHNRVSKKVKKSQLLKIAIRTWKNSLQFTEHVPIEMFVLVSICNIECVARWRNVAGNTFCDWESAKKKYKKRNIQIIKMQSLRIFYFQSESLELCKITWNWNNSDKKICQKFLTSRFILRVIFEKFDKLKISWKNGEN